MVEAKIVKEVENPLLKRREILIEAPHSGGHTPSVAETREAISALKNTPVEAVYVLSLRSMSGRQSSMGRAHVYFSPEHAKIEPEHVRVANLPPQEKKQRKEELKKRKMEMKAKAVGGKK
jgi:ribosomal protein S24E